VRVGYHLTPFWSPADRNPSTILDEAIEVVRASAHMGFEWVSMGQHWMSHPTVWPAPIPFLARLAPETGAMRIKTSVLLLPLLNAVEVAENVATLDHLCQGRLTVGVSIGYREAELQAASLTRHDRVAKLEESLELMKRLWSGEEVTFEGRFTRVQGGRMGLLPRQKPHPPIELDFSRPLEDWTVCGSPAECVSTLLRTQDEMGLDGVGFTIYSLPTSPSARIEYLQMIAEDIVAPVTKASV
jgi:alkanesulfonate monooxygenase SsuD/methylene tetrahydromethanopterin reductase-like flavin-dependent oxidoreductase (luciferase family)